MLVLFSDEFESESGAKAQVSKSRVGKQFLYCDREAHHALLFQDYFSNRSTYMPVKF